MSKNKDTNSPFPPSTITHRSLHTWLTEANKLALNYPGLDSGFVALKGNEGYTISSFREVPIFTIFELFVAESIRMLESGVLDEIQQHNFSAVLAVVIQQLNMFAQNPEQMKLIYTVDCEAEDTTQADKVLDKEMDKLITRLKKDLKEGLKNDDR